MHYPDPPMCCQHGINTHGRERCQAPQCGCERDAYLAMRQIMLQQAQGRHPSAAPPPEPPVTYRWKLTCQLDGSLDLQLNKAIFGETEDADLDAVAEVASVLGQLGEARPAESDSE
jgi:hypothetical protein